VSFEVKDEVYEKNVAVALNERVIEEGKLSKPVRVRVCED